VSLHTLMFHSSLLMCHSKFALHIMMCHTIHWCFTPVYWCATPNTGALLYILLWHSMYWCVDPNINVSLCIPVLDSLSVMRRQSIHFTMYTSLSLHIRVFHPTFWRHSFHVLVCHWLHKLVCDFIYWCHSIYLTLHIIRDVFGKKSYKGLKHV
jgi:hypothetical protein